MESKGSLENLVEPSRATPARGSAGLVDCAKAGGMRIVLQFSGGFLDGRILSDDSPDRIEARDARVCYQMTEQGQVGKRYVTVLNPAIETNSINGQGGRERALSRNHSYEVVERREEADTVWLRLNYVSQGG